MTNGFEDNPISDKFLLQISQEKSFETNNFQGKFFKIDFATIVF